MTPGSCIVFLGFIQPWCIVTEKTAYNIVTHCVKDLPKGVTTPFTMGCKYINILKKLIHSDTRTGTQNTKTATESCSKSNWLTKKLF